MAFDIMSMFQQPALNRLMQAAQLGGPGGPTNMLANPIPPQGDPWQAMRAPSVDPMQTASAAPPQPPGNMPAAPQAAAQPQGLMSKLDAFAKSDRGQIMGDWLLGLGMGSNANESLAYGAKAALAGKQARKGEADKNQTVEWLKSQGMDENQARLVASQPPVLVDYLKRLQGSPDQSQFDQRAAAARQYGLDPNTPEGQAFILSGDLPEARGGAAELGLNPQYGVDKDGNPVLLQLGKDGKGVQTQLPEGVTLSKTPIKLDAGTHYVLLDPITRQPVGQILKDLAGAEIETAGGKAQGEAIASYRSMTSKMPGLEKVITDLGALADQATYTGAGQLYDAGRAQLGMEPRDAAVARTKYISMVDNQVLPLLRDTFGAQFTVAEGESLRSTLGNPNKTPAEKKAVLEAFIAQKRRDVEALALQSFGANQVAAPPQPVGGGSDLKSKYGLD